MGKKIDWAKNLEDISQTNEKKPQGEGWFTVKEFMVNADIGTHRAYDLIRAGMENKQVEKFIGSEYSPTHRHRVKRAWYRFIDPK